MSSLKLKDDLSNCLINFDRRVLITELQDDYQLSCDEVNAILQNYLVEQQDKLKFEKRYLVHGFEEDERKKEIYKIVEEANLNVWLKKLKNSQSSLYSLEVDGGAKSPAPVFKPMKVVQCAKSKRGQDAESSSVDCKFKSSAADSIEKKEFKQEKKASETVKEPAKDLQKKITKVDSTQKNDPKKETLAPEKKIADKKSAPKKGINNFFAPSLAASKKSDDAKTSTEISKAPTPKKMQDFFKKQAEKPKSNTEEIKTPITNTSVQLFDEEEEEAQSSDEEEKLEALKRDIISSDVEIEEENDGKQASSAKRRRILDSDDEDDPPVKQEKLDIKEETKVEEAVAETYLDEDGFVITKKPKQKATSKSNKSPSSKKAPAVTMKPSPKATNKSNTNVNKDTKAATNPGAKTKQAGIMNFFSKK